jgi:hypothetical protein
MDDWLKGAYLVISSAKSTREEDRDRELRCEIEPEKKQKDWDG